MSDIGVFLQVRLASRRLPGKALLPLADRPVIAHAMRALSSLPAARFVLVTDPDSAPRLESVAAEYGYAVFAGEPQDVLKRFCDAADAFGVETIVRATGDNPLVSAGAAREALQLSTVTDADYGGILGTPYGTGVEVIRSAALDDLNRRTENRYEREHVAPGLYRNPERYRIVTRPAGAALRHPDFRVTLDTPEDYESLQAVFAQLYRGTPIELPELVAYGHRQHRSSA